MTSSKPQCPYCNGRLFEVVVQDVGTGDETGRSLCDGCQRHGDALPTTEAVMEASGVVAPPPKDWPNHGPVKQSGRYLMRYPDGSIVEVNFQADDPEDPPTHQPEWDEFRIFGPI